MKITKPIWRRVLIAIGLFLLIALAFPAPAQAQGIPYGDRVEVGTTLDQNLILSGPVIEMNGVINGDLLAVGDEITINGEVNGSLVAAGKRVTLNGPVTGSAVISALTLVLGPQASVGRDVYFLGGRVQSQDSSVITRDFNIVSLESSLAGRVNRDVHALVGPLNMINEVLNFMARRGWIPEYDFLDFLGQLPQPSMAIFRISPDGFGRQAASGMAFGLPVLRNLGLISTSPTGDLAPSDGPGLHAPFQGSTIDFERLKTWAIPVLRRLAALLVLGLLAAWLKPAQLNRASQQPRRRFWRSLFTGLLVFTMGWISIALVFVLVIALALFLLWVSLPNLGFLTGTIGVSAVGLTVSVFWLAIVFFSKLIVSAWIGDLIFQRLNSRYAQSRVWPLVVGIIVYTLLASIPYLGFLVAAISTLLGLGALWMVAMQREPAEAKPILVPAPEIPELSVVG